MSRRIIIYKHDNFFKGKNFHSCLNVFFLFLIQQFGQEYMSIIVTMLILTIETINEGLKGNVSSSNY